LLPHIVLEHRETNSLAVAVYAGYLSKFTYKMLWINPRNLKLTCD